MYKIILNEIYCFLTNIKRNLYKMMFDKDSFDDKSKFELILLPYCMAKLAAGFSPDKRLQVGSVLFKGSVIYNSSFNSRPLSADDYFTCVDPETNSSCKDLLHSEVRTIINCPVDIRKKNLVLLITNAPCLKCASAILDSGIKEVWYCGEHDDNEGVRFLRNKVILHDYSDSVIHLDVYYRKEFSKILNNNPSSFINFDKIKKQSTLP